MHKHTMTVEQPLKNSKTLGLGAKQGVLIGAVFVGFMAVCTRLWLGMRADSYDADTLLYTVSTSFTDFMTLTFSVIVEALPFVVLGALISVLIQTYIPTDKIITRLPKNRVARHGVVSFLGVLMPVCECGNVPVARSLIARGLTVRESVLFLLAAPSVNIITFVVTLQAFGFNKWVAVARVLTTIVVANITAYAVTKLLPADKVLNQDFVATCKARQHARHTLPHTLELFKTEMWLVTRFLVVGAMVAAASQILVSRDAITAIASNLVLSVVAMLALAFVISICSSVDAFFALAYVSSFSLGPILAFLVAGPMVDMKMFALLKTTFTYRTLAVITVSVFTLSFLAGIGWHYVW